MLRVNVTDPGVGNTLTFAANRRSLVNGRQKAARIILGTTQVVWWIDRHETGQILVLGPQSVQRPGPHARSGKSKLARMHHQECLRMIGDVRPQTVDHAQLIRMTSHLREKF